MATLLLIYEPAIPVSHARHGDWCLEMGTGYAFCRSVNSCHSWRRSSQRGAGICERFPWEWQPKSAGGQGGATMIAALALALRYCWQSAPASLRRVRLSAPGPVLEPSGPAFANPEVLEAERIKYAIRLPANQVLQSRIGYLLTRPVGRPPHHVRRFHANFMSVIRAFETASSAFTAEAPGGVGPKRTALTKSTRWRYVWR
jgi:hypothetical protein